MLSVPSLIYKFPTEVSSHKAVSSVIIKSVITETSLLAFITSPSWLTAFTDMLYVFAASRLVRVYVVSLTSSWIKTESTYISYVPALSANILVHDSVTVVSDSLSHTNFKLSLTGDFISTFSDFCTSSSSVFPKNTVCIVSVVNEAIATNKNIIPTNNIPVP